MSRQFHLVDIANRKEAVYYKCRVKLTALIPTCGSLLVRMIADSIIFFKAVQGLFPSNNHVLLLSTQWVLPFWQSIRTIAKTSDRVSLKGGDITVSGLGSMFYLSQRPYLVSGTLRDQLLYPQPPLEVWAKASKARHATFSHLKGINMDPEERDAALETILEAVELEYLLARYHRKAEI